MPDLCSHCLEIEAALAQRDREIERLREREKRWFDRARSYRRHNRDLNRAFIVKTHFEDAAVGRWQIERAKLERAIRDLRSREAKWREYVGLYQKQTDGLVGLAISRGITKLASDEDIVRGAQLRRELGLDGEEP